MGLLAQYQDVPSVGDCSTNVEGVCFVYDQNKRLGEFSTARYTGTLSFEYTVQITYGERSTPTDEEL